MMRRRCGRTIRTALFALVFASSVALGGIARAQPLTVPMTSAPSEPAVGQQTPASDESHADGAMPGMSVDNMDKPGMSMGEHGMTMMPAALGSGSMMHEATYRECGHDLVWAAAGPLRERLRQIKDTAGETC